jgi:ribosome-binding factor A
MASRRQEKVARVVKEAVSAAIRDGLNDPRIEGFVSVTRTELTADLRNADVYISIFGSDEAAQRRTFQALTHARSRVQGFVADKLDSKFCPVLHFKLDEVFKKTLETMNLIDQAARELEHEQPETEENI